MFVLGHPNGLEEQQREDRGGEEALSSTFHKIRPLEIRWCQNLCISCYAINRYFIVQARKILAWQAYTLIETFLWLHNTPKWRAVGTVEIL